MLKTKIKLVAVAVMMAAALTSCGGGKKVSANKLPKSGATQSISSEEEIAEFFMASAQEMQNGFMQIAEAIEKAEVNEVTPDLQVLAMGEAAKATEYFMPIMSGKGDFAKSGKLNYSINPKIGQFKGLPAGFEMGIPTSKANVQFAIGKAGKATGEVGVDLSAYFLVDSNKLGLPETSSVKGISIECAVKGNVKGDFIADEDFGEDGESNVEYFDSINDGVLTSDLTVSVDVGASLCSSSGLGGKMVVSLVGTLKGEMGEKQLANLENLFSRISRGGRLDANDYKDIPVNFDVKLSVYNDNNKETFVEAKKVSMEDFCNAYSSLVEILR